MKQFRDSHLFYHNHARMAVQGPALMVRVMEAAVQVPVFKAEAIRVVTANRIVRGVSSSSLVSRVT